MLVIVVAHRSHRDLELLLPPLLWTLAWCLLIPQGGLSSVLALGPRMLCLKDMVSSAIRTSYFGGGLTKSACLCLGSLLDRFSCLMLAYLLVCGSWSSGGGLPALMGNLHQNYLSICNCLACIFRKLMVVPMSPHC